MGSRKGPPKALAQAALEEAAPEVGVPLAALQAARKGRKGSGAPPGASERSVALPANVVVVHRPLLELRPMKVRKREGVVIVQSPKGFGFPKEAGGGGHEAVLAVAAGGAVLIGAAWLMGKTSNTPLDPAWWTNGLKNKGPLSHSSAVYKALYSPSTGVVSVLSKPRKKGPTVGGPGGLFG